ncbi:MmcQ/YjbR family DNA-binding protein [Caulobacter mirabilis]|nr:MmcQ/YjbR family DNA-binding protein [Caulobacter mirabilis]
MTHADIRALALSLPEAEELPHFDRPSFRVRGKIFITLPPSKDGRDLVVLKLPPIVKESLQQTDPDAIVSLGAWEKPGSGWTQLDIGRMDSETLADLVRLAWRQVAPKRLIAGRANDRDL